MKSRIYCLIKIITLTAFTSSGFATEVKSNNISYTIKSAPLGCNVSSATSKKFTMKSKVVLNKNFLPQNLDKQSLDLFIDESIERQVKHLMGFYKNTKTNNMNAALFAYRNMLSKSAPRETTYGSDIEVDAYLPTSRGTDQLPYLVAAAKAGKTNKNDPAIEVDYKIELMISDCSPNGFMKKNTAILPSDPYLSLWLEKKENRSPRDLGPYKLATASNCSSFEIAIFGTSNQNWFFWSPIDKYGAKTCVIEGEKKTINPEIAEVQEVLPPPKLTKEFFGNESVIKFSAIFGEIDNSDYFSRHDNNNIKKSISEIFNNCIKNKNVPECLGKWNPLVSAQLDKKYYEPGTHSFLVFLKYVVTLVKVSSFEITSSPKDKDIVLKIKGALTDSLKPIEISVYMGRTTLDYGEPATKNYTKFTHDAFFTADSIAYVGHAGLGFNMNIGELQKLWKRDGLSVVKRSKPIWVGLYNCEGVSHFGFDFDNIFKENKIQAIQTFTSGVMSGPDFPLYQLLILNRIYSNEAVMISEIIKNETPNKEFLTETWLTEK